MYQKMRHIIITYKWQLAVLLMGMLIGGGFLVTHILAKGRESENLLIRQTDLKVAETSTSSTQLTASTEELFIDIKGAVNRPGLYTLNHKSRVNDAIVAAGGFTENADQRSVNLAQKLTDEDVVYVATIGEAVSVVSSSQTSVQSDRASLINLNTATEADLQTISGIGAKRAADIIAYRNSNGGFKTVDDLNNVSGIGDKTLETIRPYVTVD